MMLEPNLIFCGLRHSMLVVGICDPPLATLFGKATTAPNSSAAAANLRSGRHDFIAAIALATPAPPASAVNTSALYNDQPANSLSGLNFDRHFRSPIKISRLSGAKSSVVASELGADQPGPADPIQMCRVNQSENDDPSIVEGIETGIHAA